MKIYFARHGESQANLLHIISNRDLPHELTERGHAQAVSLAERFMTHRIRRIYCSPLLRAVQTANILAQELRVDCEIVDGLREYDCGVAEGRSDEAAWKLWQAEYDAWVFNHNYGYQIEGGESFHDVHRRFTTFVNRLIETKAGTDDEVICISHGGIYSVMFPWVMSNVTSEVIMKHGFDYTSCIVAEHSSKGLVGVEWNGIPI